MKRLIFVPKVGTLGGGNLGKLRGGIWVRGGDQLILWAFYNEKKIRQKFILLVTTLET